MRSLECVSCATIDRNEGERKRELTQHWGIAVGKQMRRLSLAADAVCDADVLSNMLRSDQRWDLLTNIAAMNLRVAYIAHGRIGFPGFPEWLGKNSNANKVGLITQFNPTLFGGVLDQ